MHLSHHRTMAVTVLFIGICIFMFGLNRFLYVEKAHETFENYYAFRGCTALLKRTSAYGLCTISGGQTIKIVEFHGRWYLDGDLPNCIGNFCF